MAGALGPLLGGCSAGKYLSVPTQFKLITALLSCYQNASNPDSRLCAYCPKEHTTYQTFLATATHSISNVKA